MFEPPRGDVNLPRSVREMVDDELERDERLFWAAQPQPGRLALKRLPIVLFGIPWTAFALFWMWGASGFGGEGPPGPFRLFPLFGVPFVLIGLGLLSSPYWAIRKARRTAYAITGSRAIVFTGGLFGAVKIRSFGPDELHDIERKQRSDGSGDIIFAREWVGNGQNGPQTREVGFVGIERVKDVETIIRALIETSTEAP